ncbi:MAG: preprotein translocase subunit SecG [Chloroflexi bacterium]|nr:preprotein translocase subunit SecG [Chloroflexota bacterium]MBP8059404.1 preprotein translocase subunit SecG [Chloroflexota bacterium]
MAPLAPYLGAIEIVLAIAISILVIIQSKGSDLSSLTGGGGGERFGTRRGAEALLHRVTIVTAAIFFIVTMLTFVAMGQ